jgi:hypothetical protein
MGSSWQLLLIVALAAVSAAWMATALLRHFGRLAGNPPSSATPW